MNRNDGSRRPPRRGEAGVARSRAADRRRAGRVHACVLIDRRALLLHALWTFGGGLLALGLLELLLADFLDLELLARELRFDPPIRPDGVGYSGWSLAVWRRVAEQAWWWGEGLLGCFVVGMSAGVHAGLRGLRSAHASALDMASAAVALVAAVAVVLQGLAAGWVVRSAALADNFLALDSGERLRWVTSQQFLQALPHQALAAEALAGILATVLLPTAALATVAVAARCGWPLASVAARTAALALPGTLAVGAAASIRVHYQLDRMHDDPFETWTAVLQVARATVMIGTVMTFVLGVAALRGAARPRRWQSALALLVFAVGAAAAVATGPHRRAADALYPAPAHGHGHPGVAWVSAPATIDPPRVDGCPQRRSTGELAVASLDPGRGPLLEVEGMHWWLDAPNPDYPYSRWLRENSPHWEETVALLADRRVPFAQVEPFLAAAVAVGAEHLVIEGAAIAASLRHDGVVTTWNICPFGELDLEVFAAAEFAAEATWADVLATPGLVRPWTPPPPSWW